MYLCDSHVHSEFSFDAEVPVETMVQEGIKKNLSVITITDHCDVVGFDDENNSFGVVLRETVPASVAETNRVSNIYKDKIKVLTGIELGEPTHFPEKTDAVLSLADYDFILASTHEVRNREDFYFLEYNKDNVDILLKEYFNEQLEIVKWNGFDSLAHFDYPARYIAERTELDIDYSKYQNEIDEILITLAKNDKALEINTSSVNKPLGRTMASPEIVKRFKELGGKYITIGSDAHTTDALADNLEVAIDILKQAGFENYCYFEKHKPVLVKI